MHCFRCGVKQSDNNKYCSNCGVNLNIDNSEGITTGDSSVNVGLNSSIDNSTINIYRDNQEEQNNKAYIDRVKIKPIGLLGIHLRAKWLIYSGLLSVLGSFASIFSFWGVTNTWTMMLFPIGMFVMMMGLILKRHQFAHFGPLINNIEAGGDGTMYRTVIEGECPKCTGKLKLRQIGSKNNSTLVVRCTRNPDHTWSFDPTVLDDL